MTRHTSIEGDQTKATSPGPALLLEEVAKDFGGLRAVDGVSLDVAPGERRAIIGPNGAGKTTLFNLISGSLRVSAGRIVLLGSDVTRLAPHRRAALGLGRTYQITNLFPRLTVAENVAMAAQGMLRIKFSVIRRPWSDPDVSDRVDMAIEQVGLGEVRDAPASLLSHGEQRQLELALALASRPRMLLLDEPAAGLSSAERALMGRLISGLSRDLTLIIIEHDVDLALGLVDRVTCLHYGNVVAEDTPDAIRRNELVQEVYLGAG